MTNWDRFLEAYDTWQAAIQIHWEAIDSILAGDDAARSRMGAVLKDLDETHKTFMKVASETVVRISKF